MNRKRNRSQVPLTAPDCSRDSSTTCRLLVVVLYVVLVLGIDALASLGVDRPVDWGMFYWRIASLWRLFSLTPPEWTLTRTAAAFDLFKFLFWFVLPLIFCIRRMDWRWFSPRRFKRLDWALLAAMMLLGTAAVLSIRFIPALREAYPGMSHLPGPLRREYGLAYLVWVFAWLPGWEFMHRYFLLRVLVARYPRYGWLLVPFFEGVYHLQKPLIEAAGMVGFSLVLTFWSMKRQNLLLPFLAHLFIEIALIVSLLYIL